MICKICKKEFKNFQTLGIHIHFHHKEICVKEYYDLYLKKENEGCCRVCGKPCQWKTLRDGYRLYCSNKCQVNSPETKEKSKQTKFKRFGEGNYFSKENLKSMSKKQKENATERVKKLKETNLKRYGSEWAIQNKEISDKRNNTCNKRYGNNCSLHGTNQEKTEEIFIQKYGTNSPVKNKEVFEKIRKTNLERYGSEMPWGAREVIEKRKENYLKKTGYEHPMQNPEFRKEIKRKYKYDDVLFDSSWEISYYIWLKDNKIDFKFHPLPLEYEFNKEKHFYFPDFIVENKYVEIKGPQLFQKMLEPNTLDNAKYNCMIKNGVEIKTNCDEYIKYVNEKYGKDFIKKFRYKK